MKTTIRTSVFETNSSSEHTFIYLSKEMFEKWRRGEVKMKGDGYPVCDLTDDDFTAAKKKPDTVYDTQTDEYPKEEWLRERLDAIDDPTMKADLLYVIRKYIAGKDYRKINFRKWNGSYVAMLLTYMSHHGECVARKDANKKYVDPEEWGPEYDEVLAAFRNALHEVEEWKGINDKKYSELRKMVNDLRNKEEITAEDISELWEILFVKMEDHKIKDKEFKAFADAFYELYDHDVVGQNAHLDFADNGKNVRIHIWGRDDGQ